MAHGPSKRADARRRYVVDRQGLSTIAGLIDVTEPTLRRWRREAEGTADDWDRARTATLVAGVSLDQIVAQVVEDYMSVHARTIDDLKTSELPAVDRAKILASLADSLNKTVAASGRVAPKISELGVALDVLRRFADYVSTRHPASAPALLEALDGFGAELGEVYQ